MSLVHNIETHQSLSHQVHYNKSVTPSSSLDALQLPSLPPPPLSSLVEDDDSTDPIHSLQSQNDTPCPTSNIHPNTNTTNHSPPLTLTNSNEENNNNKTSPITSNSALYQNCCLPWNHHMVIKTGYLMKCKGKYGWQKYWVVLRNNQLTTYKDELEYVSLNVINIPDMKSIIELRRGNRENVLGMFSHKKAYYFQAFSKESLRSWVCAIYCCSPFIFRKRFLNSSSLSVF